MQAYTVLLRYELGQLARSWLVRIWIILLVAPALFLVVVAANSEEQASEMLAAYFTAGLVPISALAVALISGSAIPADSVVAADSILSRSVTRSEYIAAKVTSRFGITLFVFGAVAVPFSYLILRYSAEVDTSFGGVVTGLSLVAFALVCLSALGIALSTVLHNSLISALIALVVIIVSGAALQFLGLTWMSTTALLDDLPATFRGEIQVSNAIRMFLLFVSLAAVSVMAAVLVFRRSDL